MLVILEGVPPAFAIRCHVSPKMYTHVIPHAIVHMQFNYALLPGKFDSAILLLELIQVSFSEHFLHLQLAHQRNFQTSAGLLHDSYTLVQSLGDQRLVLLY